MKKFWAVLLTLVMVFSITACGKKPKNPEKETSLAESETTVAEEPTTNPAPADGNLIPGGDFSYKDSRWSKYLESGGNGDFDISSKKLTLNVITPGKVSHAVQVYCDGFELLQNTKYEFSFEVSSTVARTFEWRMQINGGDYHAYVGEEKLEIGPDATTIKCEFVMNEPSDPAPRLCFNFGYDESNPDLASHTVTISNVKLIVVDSSQTIEVDTNTGEVDINLNQLGYRPDDVKKAVFRDCTKDDSFSVIDMANNSVVYTGKLSGEKKSFAAGETLTYADFSDLKTPGTYKVKANKSGESYTFYIGDNVYDEAFNAIIKMLYLQRCGSELTEEFAGDFAHKECHTGIATIYGTDEQIDVSGGWHDAGDYGRYVVPGCKAVADLLLAYELNPSAFGDNVGIPESGNNIPDILDEARYELEWMFKMQDVSGGVHHKVTGLSFEGQIVPDEDDNKLYVLPISNWDTGDFAAVMAMAARVYKDIDSAFADKCLAASAKAKDYFIAHRGERGYKNPSNVTTGEYPDGRSTDEYIWMLAETFKTTGDTEVLSLLDDIEYDDIEESGLGWATVDLYGYYAYLTSEGTNEATKKKILEKFTGIIDEICAYIDKDGYGSSLNLVYPWGSNMTIANNGVLLLMAKVILNDKDYTAYAKTQLDYIFGNNALSYSFVTGYGEHSPKNPHHRPSLAYEKTVPGMLVGGPDSNLEDPFAKAVLSGVAAAKCYRDSSQSFSCNEITIYWNSPLIALMAAFM